MGSVCNIYWMNKYSAPEKNSKRNAVSQTGQKSRLTANKVSATFIIHPHALVLVQYPRPFALHAPFLASQPAPVQSPVQRSSSSHHTPQSTTTSSHFYCTALVLAILSAALFLDFPYPTSRASLGPSNIPLDTASPKSVTDWQRKGETLEQSDD